MGCGCQCVCVCVCVRVCGEGWAGTGVPGLEVGVLEVLFDLELRGPTENTKIRTTQQPQTKILACARATKRPEGCEPAGRGEHKVADKLFPRDM